MNVITGGPAFPFTEFQKDGAKVSAYGMTLRDYFAAKAMQGLCSNLKYQQSSNQAEIVSESFKIADAMLKARGKYE